MIINVGCVQPEILQSRKACYSEVEILLKTLIETHQNLDMVCFPERWVPLNKDFSDNFQTERGSDYIFMKKLAKEFRVSLISGAIWEKRKDSNKPVITSYYFDHFGDEVGRQDKIHLYSYEKKQFEAGNELTIFNLKNVNFTILICFDMAFFETPRLSVEKNADILFSPTQIREEGMENWDIYLKARALENRVPIVACNTFGKIFDRTFPGNSKIISFIPGYISPSKLKIIEAPFKSNGFIYDSIDLDFPKKIRALRFQDLKKKSKIKVNYSKN